MSRGRIYGLLAFALVIFGWANFRALPLARDARHYAAELESLPASVPQGKPSAPPLRAELQELRAEEERLQVQVQEFAALAAKSRGDTIEGRMRAAGLSVESLRTAARGRRARGLGPSLRRPRPGQETYLILEAGGDFAQARSFVDGLASLGAPLQIDRFTLSLERQVDRAGPLRLTLEVRP